MSIDLHLVVDRCCRCKSRIEKSVSLMSKGNGRQRHEERSPGRSYLTLVGPMLLEAASK